jgi:hypothetical protein
MLSIELYLLTNATVVDSANKFVIDQERTLYLTNNHRK